MHATISASTLSSATAAAAAPRPICAAYASSVRLLHSSGLAPDERAAVEAHLAGCAWCQNQLATYDLVDTALRRHCATDPPFAAVGSRASARTRMHSAPAGISAGLRADDVTEGADADWLGALAPAPPATSHVLRRPRHDDRYLSLTPLARVAFALVLGMLAVALVARIGMPQQPMQASVSPPVSSTATVAPGVPPSPTAVPPLDPQAEAYVELVRIYYPPLLSDLTSSRACEAGYGLAAPKNRLSVLLGCRDTEATVLESARTFESHLNAATPPARWQDAHRTLTQAVHATILAYQQRVAAIDARDAAQFDRAAGQTVDALALYCDPFALLDAELPAESALDAPSGTCILPPHSPGQPYAAGRI
jgi:hypothetical protein